VTIERDEIEALIKCGAFDEVGSKRAGPFDPLPRCSGNGISASRKNRLCLQHPTLPFSAIQPLVVLRRMALPEDTPDYSREQKLRMNGELLEVCVSGHRSIFCHATANSGAMNCPRTPVNA